MAVWQVVVLLDLALALGVGGGYLWWGRQVERLQREVIEARAAAAGPREYRAEGVIRAVLPEVGVVVITHDEITGYMPAMTMGFRALHPGWNASQPGPHGHRKARTLRSPAREIRRGLVSRRR